MPSIFQSKRAFAPFYDDIVSVEGQRQGRVVKTGGLMACVLDQGLDDAIGEGDADSTRRRYSVSIRTADWPDVFAPQRGDTVVLADGNERLSVLSVARSLGDIVMEARSC
jgi:hypothetical protein